MEISPVFQVHPDDDIWEEYALGRLDAKKEAASEEHLLLCERCQRVLARTDEYVRLMKFSTARLAAPRLRPRWRILQFGKGERTGGVAMAGALAVTCLAVVAWVRPGLGWSGHSSSLHPLPITAGSTEPATSPVLVRLESFRAAGAAGLNRAPAKRPLDLSIPLGDISSGDIPVSAQYRLELVTFEGEAIWRGVVAPKDGSLSAHVAKDPPAGTYWVRLYAPSSELLAEYGLKLE